VQNVRRNEELPCKAVESAPAGGENA
jgi:hypothetical protein